MHKPSFTAALALLVTSCATTRVVPLTAFLPLVEGRVTATSPAECQRLSSVAGTGIGRTFGRRLHREAELEPAAEEAIRTLRWHAAREGANYVLLERATWSGIEVVVKGAAYRCPVAAEPRLVCTDDAPHLSTCAHK